MAGIYIHIPFCKRKCGYCDFFSVTDVGSRSAVLRGIVRELRAERSFIGDEPVKTIYIGGGTPTVYAPSDLQSLIDTVKELWDCTGLGEITAEANPDDLTPEYLAALAATDVNRLSIGVQSFSDCDLRLMNRRHTAQAAVDAVRKTQRAGFDNITIDLIYGIPAMSSAEWRQNIETALGLGVQHISAYHLTIEPDTPFGRLAAEHRLAPVDDAVSEEQYLILHDMLTEAGFEHYEISNFALLGFRARHNSSYWHGESYLGAGPSAHSFNGAQRRSSARSIAPYLDEAAKPVYDTETLTPADRYNEFVMTSLRCAEGVDVGVMRQKFGEQAAADFIAGAERHIGSLLRVEGARYYIPAKKYLLSDVVIGDLFVSK